MHFISTDILVAIDQSAVEALTSTHPAAPLREPEAMGTRFLSSHAVSSSHNRLLVSVGAGNKNKKG